MFLFFLIKEVTQSHSQDLPAEEAARDKLRIANFHKYHTLNISEMIEILHVHSENE